MKIRYGNVTRHENDEKNSTMIGPFSPRFPRARTHVYALPAPNPPSRPIRDIPRSALENDGFIMPPPQSELLSYLLFP